MFMELLYNQEIPLLGIYPKGTGNRCSKKNSYTNVHWSSIQDSQKAETTQMSIKPSMNKENVVYPWSELFIQP